MRLENTSRSGFTLVELAIVLVVIGLLAGGVLAGRELLYSATMRAAISDIERFNTAAHAFQAKYECLPGDCPDAIEKGLTAPAYGNGTGDGHVSFCLQVGKDCNSAANPFFGINIGESYNFWSHLATAGLLTDQIRTVANPTAPYYTPRNRLPLARKQPGAIPAWCITGELTFAATAGGGGMTPHNYFLCNSPNLFMEYGYIHPRDIYYVDTKLDDGYPFTGNTRAWNNFSINYFPVTMNFEHVPAPAAGGPAAAVCVRNDTVPNSYNIVYAGNYNGVNMWAACNVLIKAAF